MIQSFSVEYIYNLTLTSGMVLMLAYGLYSLLTLNPQGDIYKGYIKAQLILGVTLLTWSGHLLLHILLNLRYFDDTLAQTVSLSTYFMLVCGFEMVLHSLLDSNYFSPKIWRPIAAKCATYTTLLLCNYFIVPESLRGVTIEIFAVPLFIHMCFAAHRAHKRYCDVKRNIDNYYSDNTSNAVSWMYYCIYIMLGFGFLCVLIPFGSALTDAVTMIVAMVVLTYLMMSIKNYTISIAIVQPHFAEVAEPEIDVDGKSDARSQQLQKSIDEWVASHGFIKLGITIEDVAEELCSNRTYVSAYINRTYNVTFKNWISDMKIEYAKKMLLDNPEYSTMKVAEMVGYARSSFNKAFMKATGDTPAKWRDDQLGSSVSAED